MTRTNTSSEGRAIIVGGSLAGLFTGTLLRSQGWTVDIYERSPHSLSSRGGGIVLQPEIILAFQQAGVDFEFPFGVVVNERLYLEPDGSIAQRMLMRQTLTSWNLIYEALYRHFPVEHYHPGMPVVDISQDGALVTAVFADGSRESADLLVGADGARSTVRQHLLPDYAPSYAGYVAYRGLVDESELAALDEKTARLLTERFVFYQFPNSHMLQYLVPGEDGSLVPGERRFNWVWYVNHTADELPTLLTDKTGQRRDSIPPGMIAPAVEQQMRDYANQMLPPPLQTLVAATQEPFIQPILDLGVPQMAFGRVALVGDAAFVPRPHTAAGVSKGASNAIALADALASHDHDVTAALQNWEEEQLRLGLYLWRKGEALGERSQFMYGKGRHTGTPVVA